MVCDEAAEDVIVLDLEGVSKLVNLPLTVALLQHFAGSAAWRCIFAGSLLTIEFIKSESSPWRDTNPPPPNRIRVLEARQNYE